ncbi:MAG TPA: hypothetical protein VFQ07_06635 [Candidatus Polarisedimenticolia bacterium]|nr:hypothetical protein [Candidatus Polarisedimenticolia bacterium]
MTRPGEVVEGTATQFPVMVGYDGALLTADGTAAFTLTEFSIPIPKFLWFVLDDKVTVNFHAVGRPSGR